MAFFEHEVTEGSSTFINTDHVVTAEYYTMGDEAPLLIAHLTNGAQHEVYGEDAHRLAELLRSTL